MHDLEHNFQPRRAAASRARMQIRRMEVVRNFVAEQLQAIPAVENAPGSLAQTEGSENQRQHIQQRRSQSEQRLRSVMQGSSGIGTGGGSSRSSRRSTIAGSGRRFRLRARSLTPASHAVRVSAAQQHFVVDDNSNEDIRLIVCYKK